MCIHLSYNSEVFAQGHDSHSLKGGHQEGEGLIPPSLQNPNFHGCQLRGTAPPYHLH